MILTDKEEIRHDVIDLLAEQGNYALSHAVHEWHDFKDADELRLTLVFRPKKKETDEVS